MYLPLSWRWPRWSWVCYAWCTSWIPFGVALRFNVSRGGAGLVRLASSTSDNSEGCLCADLAILGVFPPRYASPDWVWRPIHGACSLLLQPCTTGALAPLFAPARNALDAALALSRLGLPRCFHWLFHSLGKPLVVPSERPIHGTCSLLLLPCTTGALAPLFAPARNALDATLDLSRLGLPRCFHWLFHSLGKPLVVPSWLRLCVTAKVPVSSAGRSPR
ncbi:hypothetical protein V6N12_009446 [Hibiscus sabdariffa]|uniref:Secreted protein n=1 Tax=Hibiscus sabdariffa TaxID=183260 RepID=A0ABR2E960_9ROSI